MITITQQEFLDYTGINLELELHDLDDSSNKVDRTILLWTKRVYNEMRKNSVRAIPKDEDLTENQVQTIKDAICEYGEYYLKNGDLYRQSGFDEERGKLLDASDLEKIKFPTHIIDMLRASGLIRRSLNFTTKYSQDHDIYW